MLSERQLAGCRLERADGRLDEACKRSFPTPANSLARFLHLDRLFPRSRFFGAYRRTYDDPAGPVTLYVAPVWRVP